MEAYPSPSWAAVRYILGFGLLQGVLQVWLPGPVHRGPTTPRGNVPTYTANGVPTLATTLLIFLATWRAGLFDPGAVYDCMGSIVSTSNIMSLILCTLLYLKANDFSFVRGRMAGGDCMGKRGAKHVMGCGGLTLPHDILILTNQ